ncbi:MAG: hypothetical protein ACUVTX_07920 [Bacteroidales bacterium]
MLSQIVAGTGFVRPAAGAGEAGMAYVCVMKPGLWSSFHNQAVLSHYRSAALGFSYENRFSLKEFSTRSVCFTIPSANGAVGAFYSFFGYSDYKRQTAGIASSVILAPGLSAGVQADILSEHSAGDYEDFMQVTCEAGLMFNLSENVTAGIHIFNPVPSSMRNVPLPSSLRAGAGIKPAKNLFAGIETEMITGQNLNIKTGFEYEVSHKLQIRGGYSTRGPSFTFGVGYTVRQSHIDAGFMTHPKLGIISSVSISFVIAGAKN